MLEPIDMAWELVRKVAGTTMFDKGFNDGMSLPFQVAKKISLVLVKILKEEEEMWTNGEVDPKRYWKSVYDELIKLEL